MTRTIHRATRRQRFVIVDQATIERSPLGYLRTLEARWQEGDMGLRYAGVVTRLW